MKPRLAGLLALAFYLAHAIDLLRLHPPEVLLWSCDVAAFLVAVSLLGGFARINAAAGIVLLAGLPLWVVDLASGGEFRPTSPLIHVGSLALGIAGMRRLGVPRASGVVAVLVMAGATLAARFTGSVEENVNLAHAVQPGWEGTFPSHGIYLAALGTVVAAVCIGLEPVLRRIVIARR